MQSVGVIPSKQSHNILKKHVFGTAFHQTSLDFGFGFFADFKINPKSTAKIVQIAPAPARFLTHLLKRQAARFKISKALRQGQPSARGCSAKQGFVQIVRHNILRW